MRICKIGPFICLLLLATGCARFADLCKDDLDRAHESGRLSDADYYRLRIQRDAARRQQQFQQQQAFQAHQQAVYNNYINGIQQATAHPVVITPLPPSTPTFGLGNSPVPYQPAPYIQPIPASPPPVQPELPSRADLNEMNKGRGWRTGATGSGKDGTLFYQYRLPDGTTYWSPSH